MARKKRIGRPPGSKNKIRRGKPAKKAAVKKYRKVSRTPRVYADVGAAVAAIIELGRMLDSRLRHISQAINELADLSPPEKDITHTQLGGAPEISQVPPPASEDSQQTLPQSIY